MESDTVRVLCDMGFPLELCRYAANRFGDHLNPALTWILDSSNAEEIENLKLRDFQDKEADEIQDAAGSSSQEFEWDDAITRIKTYLSTIAAAYLVQIP